MSAIDLSQRGFGLFVLCFAGMMVIQMAWKWFRSWWETGEILHDPDAMAAIAEGEADLKPTIWLNELPFLKVHSMDVLKPLLNQPNRDQWRFAESGAIAAFSSFPIYVDANLPRDLAVFVKPDGSMTFIKIVMP
jgi:hypothetical protein